MSDVKRCPRCQAEIPATAPEGLCPQCLLQAGIGTAPGMTEPYTPRGAGFVPPLAAALQPLFPHLEILALLGSGGMGAVYKARQPALDRFVALKILPPEYSRDPTFAERFTREARALAQLSHPNIVGVHDIGQAGGYCFFIMEYVDGVNVRQALRAGNLKPAEALQIVPQICDALQFAHDEGIVHRDIKPENILLDKKGRVKIADFGLAKLLGKTANEVTLTGTQQVMGTLHYMAPEQLEGTRDVDHRADIYSLGVTFYEMLTGELPLGRFAAPSKKVQIDVRLDEVVLRSLEKAPEQRYQHASDVKTDIETIRRERPVAEASPPREATVIHSRTMPRDLTDIVLMIVLSPMIMGICFGIPFVLTFLVVALATSDAARAASIAAVVGGITLFGLFVILALGAPQRVTIDERGITVHRFAGPGSFLGWSEIRHIHRLSRWDVFREVWLWPGLPPRGSIVGMSASHFYRITCRDSCWYFCPQDVGAFIEAIVRHSQGYAGRIDIRHEAAAEGKPGRPWFAQVLGALLIFCCVAGLVFITQDFLVPADVPANIANDERLLELFEVYRHISVGANYLTALSGIGCGLGLLLLLPWGRRAAVWFTIVWLVYGLLTLPVDFAIEFQRLGQAPPADQAKQLAFRSTMGTLFELVLDIAVLVYLTRPRVIAAFESRAEP